MKIFTKSSQFLVLLFILIFLASLSLASQGINLKVSTDKKEYVEGEELFITIIPEKNCNVVLLYITASGDAVRILLDGDGPGTLKAGKTYRTPAASENRELSISAPFGKEKVIVYATDKALPAIAGEDLGDGLFMIPGGEKAIDKLLPDASKFIWELETFSKEQRGFSRSKPESPIDMTGAAGRDLGSKTADEIK